MRLTVSKTALLPALTLMARVPETKQGGGILLQTSGGFVRLTAQNKAITITRPIPANVDAPGSVILDPATFLQVVKNAPDTTIFLSEGDNFRIKTTSGRSTTTLNGADPTTAPPLPSTSPAPELQIAAAKLRELLDKTADFIAPNDNRYGLNGLHLEVSPNDAGFIRAVATDGNRLGWAEVPFTGTLQIGRRLLIPRPAVAFLRSAIDDAAHDAPVVLWFPERSAVATVGDTTITMRLLEAEFPKYNEVLPNSNATDRHHIDVDRSVLTDALRRVGFLAVDGSRSIRMECVESALTLSARKLDVADGRDEITLATPAAEPFSIGVNCAFLLEALAALKEDTIRIGYGTALAPLILQALETRTDVSPHILCVLMPVRLD